MNVRELLKERESYVARAKALTDAADKESRDLTDVERAEFEELLGKDDETGKVGVLDAKIAQIQAEREKLRTAAEKKFNVEPEKPAPAQTNVKSKADFDKLSPADRMAFIKAGGKVQD